MEAQLGVFARLPVPGKVKTRLAAAVGAELATSMYKALAENCFREACRCKGGVTLFASVAAEAGDCGEWVEALGLEMAVVPQVESPDLGQRMTQALNALLSNGAAKALIVGTDIPDISAEVIAAAVAELDSHEMVLGPACDGGYYLIGVTRLPPDVLQGIEWSTSSVYADTRRQAEGAGMRVAPAGALPVLQDIDFLQDLLHWYDGTAPTDHRTRSDHPLRGVVEPLVQASRRQAG